MNRNRISVLLLGAAALLFSVLSGPVYAQMFKLDKLELVNAAGFYRLMVRCNGVVTYVDQYRENPPRLFLYLRDTRLNLVRSSFRFDRGPVAEIRATQWKTSPFVVKIELALALQVEYEVRQTVDGFYVDLYRSAPQRTTEPVETEVWQGFAAEQPAHAAAENNAFRSVRQNSSDAAVNNGAPGLLGSPDPIFLDVKAAEIANVLRLLARQSGLNIVASRDVSGPVTVTLEGVTISKALDMVVKANGYDYLVTGDVILVKPPDKFQLQELQTKVYRLKYIDANNLKNTLSQVLSEHAKVQVFYPNFEPNQPEQEGAEKKILRSSILIVSDMPANIQQLEAVIGALDVPTPQIMIEAKLIEIAPEGDQNLGINWSKAINARVFQEVLLPSGLPDRFSAGIPLGGGSINYGTLKFDEYNSVINFLDSHTNSKLVSNPRILAMDNQEATISVGTNFPVPQINRGIGGQGDVVTFQYRDVNISLKVTPHVAEDETITLHVNPVIEEITGQVVAGENTAPITSKREVETVVNLRSNETIVIGGLIRENNVETISKVWLLGDIPLLGNLFRNKEKSRKQTDLLIFITPRLLGDF